MAENLRPNHILSDSQEGILTFGGVRVILMDIEGGYLGLRRQIEALVGREMTNVLLQQAGVNGGAFFARPWVEQADNQKGSEVFRECVSAFQAAGFGRFEIETLEWPIGRVVIKAWNTFESWISLQQSSSGMEPVCAYTSGVLVGFINVISGRKDVVCIKHKCQSLGDACCLYELLPAGETEGEPVISFIPDPALGRHVNLLEMMFDRMPMGIAIFDSEACVQRSNPTWDQMIERYTNSGYQDMIPGNKIYDLFPDSEPLFKPLLERVLAGEFVKTQAFNLEVENISSYWDAVFSPLIEKDQVIGFMVVVVDVTERVSTQKNLEQTIKERTHELATLMGISHNIAATQELDSLLGNLLDDLKKVIDYDGSTILSIEDNRFVVKAYRGPLAWDQASTIEFPLDDPLDRLILESRDRVIIRDTKDDTPEAEAFRQSVGAEIETIYSHIRSWIGVPLIIKDDVIGHLAIEHHEPGFFTPGRVDIISTFGNQLAVVLENARLQMAANQAAVLDERQRIARELHDSVSQALYSISLGAHTLQKLLEQENIPEDILEKLKNPLDFIMTMTDSGLDELRTVIFELRPDILQKEGLVVALDRQADMLRTRHKTMVNLHLCEEPPLSFNEKESLYRLAQEALTNIVKHAHASTVTIRLEEIERDICLLIQDDGSGFDPQIDHPGHLGLKTMRERVGKLGGTLDIISAPDQGTGILASVPLHQ